MYEKNIFNEIFNNILVIFLILLKKNRNICKKSIRALHISLLKIIRFTVHHYLEGYCPYYCYSCYLPPPLEFLTQLHFSSYYCHRQHISQVSHTMWFFGFFGMSFIFIILKKKDGFRFDHQIDLGWGLQELRGEAYHIKNGFFFILLPPYIYV